MYSPIKASRSLFTELRGISHHVRVWGDDHAPPLFLFHGAWDASPTFQFVVDALKQQWRILALDWRGYGKSAWTQAYWLCELVADMEAFVDRFSPTEPITGLGHSMGAHALEFFASVRPGRVGRLVSLDGFALADESQARALQRYRSWLDGVKVEPSFKSYSSTAQMAERLMRGNLKLTADKAAFLAANLSRKQDDGTFAWAFDPRHRDPFPVETRPDGWSTGLQNIATSVLLLSSGLSRVPRLPIEEVESRISQVPRHSHIHIENVGHNLHHEAPEFVADIIEPFLRTGALPPSAAVQVDFSKAR